MRLCTIFLVRNRRASLLLIGIFLICLALHPLLYPYGTEEIVSDPAILAAFLKDYQIVCANQTVHNDKQKIGQLPLCPCLPTTLAGLYNVKAWYLKLTGGDFSSTISEVPLPSAAPVTVGGAWRPTSCHARQRVAIIIPFRNRHQHLSVFTRYMHSFLQRQQLDYTIFVIEQASPDIFNRAAVMNAGVLEVNKLVPDGFDCYIFHDVDLLPEDDRNMYTCFYAPVHLGAYMNKFRYRMPYPEFFGGAISLRGDHILSINGFPNKFYGWGGEDDAVYSRILLQNLTINRYPQMVGRSYMFKHELDGDNPENPLRREDLTKEAEEYMQVGLSSVKYKTNKVSRAEQYTMITISIEQEYNPTCIVDKRFPSTKAGNYVNCLTKENFNASTLECCRDSNGVFCCNLTRRKYARLLLFLILTGTMVAILGIYVRRRKKTSPVQPTLLQDST